MKKIIYIILILVLLFIISCFKLIDITIQNKVNKDDIEFKVYNSRMFCNRVYFDLEFINKSKQDKLLIVTFNTLLLKDNDGYFYPVYVDEFLSLKTSSKDIYIKKGESVKLSFYSLTKLRKRDDNITLVIKDNIISDIPLLHKKYEEEIDDINHIFINYVSFDGKSYLDAIGYTVECKNKKEFYIEVQKNNKVTVYDRQKKKHILEFNKSEIGKYIRKICNY